MHVGRNPSSCEVGRVGGGDLIISNLALLLVVFQVMVRQAWQARKGSSSSSNLVFYAQSTQERVNRQPHIKP